MRCDSGWFVDDHQVIVFVDDLEVWNVNCNDFERVAGIGNGHFKACSSHETITLLQELAVHARATVF